MKRLVIEIDDSLHKEAKLEAVKEEKSLKQYVLDLIKQDLDAKKRVIVVVWRLHDYSKTVTPKGACVIIT